MSPSAKCSMLLCVLLSAQWIPSVLSARILGIIAINLKSHLYFIDPLFRTLADNGHEVTLASGFFHAHPHPNITYVDLGDTLGNPLDKDTPNPELSSFTTTTGNVRYFYAFSIRVCVDAYRSENLQNFLRAERGTFDVIITQAYNLNCFYPLAERFNASVISVQTFRYWEGTDMFVGNPVNPAYVPRSMGTVGRNMGFLQRVINALDYALYYTIHHTYLTWKMEEMYRRVNICSTEELDSIKQRFKERKYSLIFYNSHFSVFPRPLGPNIVEIGGIHITDAKPLPKYLDKIINESEKGVVLVSFGSITNTTEMPMKKAKAFLDAFSTIPHTVLWKYDNPFHLQLPKNVILGDWFPQRDILQHEKVKGMITHGGIHSLYEAIYTATPVIGIPMRVEQGSNVRGLEDLGVGIFLEYKNIDKDILVDALHKMLYNKSYATRMKTLSASFRDRPMSPKQLVLYWTEYVVRHKGALHLQNAGCDLPFYKYLLLDVIGFIVFLLSGIVAVIYIICKKSIIIISRILKARSLVTTVKKSQ